MDERGTPVKDKARENVSLRLGDWGFFYHGLQFRDRTALDRAGHVITMSETGDWQAFLSTTRLDAGGALKRVAWLFNASGIEPSTAPPKVGSRDQLTVPTLTAADGVITFQGWFLFNRGEFPPDLNDPKRVTITAAKNTARVVTESARKP